MAAAAAAALVVAMATPAGAVDFSDPEKDRLARGKVVRRLMAQNGVNGRFGGSGWVVIDAPRDQVFTAIQDYEHYKQIYPNIVECTVLSRKGKRILLRMQLGHPLISVTYHVELHPDKSTGKMTFRMVENMPHDLDDITGYWRVFPLEGNRTLVAYVLKVDAPMGIVNVLPDAFIESTVHGLLGVPGILKRWMEKRSPGRYARKQ